MIKLVNFSDSKMTKAQRLCSDSARNYGVDYVHEWGYITLHDWFKDMNREVFAQERGCGYWIWKPHIVFCTMLGMNDGDILIYADSGVEFIAPVKEIIDRMDEDIFFFTNGWKHVEWCKMDCMVEINHDNYTEESGFDWDGYSNKSQVQASVFFIRVNQKTRDFIKEWLLYCQFPGFIDDSPSKLPNYPTFAEHRHDQALLTCVAIKHGYTIDHWWPTQYSMHLPRKERDNYPVIFSHHRRRNSEW